MELVDNIVWESLKGVDSKVGLETIPWVCVGRKTTTSDALVSCHFAYQEGTSWWVLVVGWLVIKVPSRRTNRIDRCWTNGMAQMYSVFRKVQKERGKRFALQKGTSKIV